MKIIFKSVVGSRLYGTNTPDSDVDTKGVALPSPSDLLGVRETARSHWTFGEDTIYSVSKFLWWIYEKGNPTLIELLFVPKSDFILVEDPLWERIKCVGRSFISNRCYEAYFGYILAQYRLITQLKKQSGRATLFDQFGYDVKSSSHTYRVTKQAQELFTHKSFNPRLEGESLEVARAMRFGQLSFEETKRILEEEIEVARKCESLQLLPPPKAFSVIDDFVCEIHREVIQGHTP